MRATCIGMVLGCFLGAGVGWFFALAALTAVGELHWGHGLLFFPIPALVGGFFGFFIGSIIDTFRVRGGGIDKSTEAVAAASAPESAEEKLARLKEGIQDLERKTPPDDRIQKTDGTS